MTIADFKCVCPERRPELIEASLVKGGASYTFRCANCGETFTTMPLVVKYVRLPDEMFDGEVASLPDLPEEEPL